MAYQAEYHTTNLDSQSTQIVGLSPDATPMDEFQDIWYYVFLWSLFSSFLVHLVAAAVAFGRLRKHKMGRCVPMVIFIMGLVSPLTGGAITSCTIAGVYRASGMKMAPLYALIWGVGQTLVVIFLSFTRILATL